MSADTKEPIFFDGSGRPLHLLRKHQDWPDRWVAWCGGELPCVFAPKPRHFCDIFDVEMQCPACEEIRLAMIDGYYRARECPE